LALGGLGHLAYVKRSPPNGPAKPALCAWAFFYGPMGEEPFYFLEKKTKTTFLDSDRWDFIPKNCFFKTYFNIKTAQRHP